MNPDGCIGQLSSDHVTKNVVASLDDIQGKVNSGRIKAEHTPISDPTILDHMMHWGRDEAKWHVKEHVLRFGGSSCVLVDSHCTVQL